MQNIPTQFLQNREKEVRETTGLDLIIPCEMKLGPWNHSKDCGNAMQSERNWYHSQEKMSWSSYQIEGMWILSYLLQVKWWWLDSFAWHTSTFQCLEYTELKHHQAQKHIWFKMKCKVFSQQGIHDFKTDLPHWVYTFNVLFSLLAAQYTTHRQHSFEWFFCGLAIRGFFFNFVTGRKWWSSIRWSC
jgi:hypothetical protein